MKYTRKLKLVPPQSSSIVNALTVDVEDYFQVSGFDSHIARDAWERFPSRVQQNTMRLLEMFADRDLRATFFVLGWVAERFPELVQTIRAAGHEVGSHSQMHRLVYDMSPAEFRADVRRSRDVLQQALGERVRIYRAPSFSITRKSLWALEVLVEEGFEIDSSIFPVRHDRYGIPDAEPTIHQIATPSGPIWEVPGTVVRRFGGNLPVSGGGYLRLLPLALTKHWLRQINQREGRPFMFYVHPWEIDPKQPRLKIGSLLSRWRHYQNLDSCEAKLLSLLGEFRFDSLSNVVCNVAGAKVPTAGSQHRAAADAETPHRAAPAAETPHHAAPAAETPYRAVAGEPMKPEGKPTPLKAPIRLPGDSGGRVLP